jgi:hypothetical protein
MSQRKYSKYGSREVTNAHLSLGTLLTTTADGLYHFSTPAERFKGLSRASKWKPRARSGYVLLAPLKQLLNSGLAGDP